MARNYSCQIKSCDWNEAFSVVPVQTLGLQTDKQHHRQTDRQTDIMHNASDQSLQQALCIYTPQWTWKKHSNNKATHCRL